MRTLLVALALLFASTAFVVAAPSAQAVGTCTFLSGTLDDGPRCPAMACYGTSWSYGDYYYTCQHEIPWPCQYCMIL